MACVASRLLDQMQQHPQKRELTSVAQRPHRQLIQTRRVRRDLPAPLTGFAVTTPQLLRLETVRAAMQAAWPKSEPSRDSSGRRDREQ